jgi:hypothetical protein
MGEDAMERARKFPRPEARKWQRDPWGSPPVPRTEDDNTNPKEQDDGTQTQGT